MKNNKELSFIDIVLNADAETIQQALEAKNKIDALLTEREIAYQKIFDLEVRIEEVVGEKGVFPFPEPPVPIANFGSKKPKSRKILPPRKTASPVNKTFEPSQMIEEKLIPQSDINTDKQGLDSSSDPSISEASESSKNQDFDSGPTPSSKNS